MKKLSYLFMLLTLCFSMGAMTSCSDDDEEPQRDQLASTKWEFVQYFQNAGTIEYNLVFSDNGTARYRVLSYDAGGRLEETMLDVTYTYQLSGNTFILTPNETSKAKMQGTIISGIFIQLRNLSNNEDLDFQLQKV